MMRCGNYITRLPGVSIEEVNRWTGVHRLDAAHLFRLASQKGAARAYYHGVDQANSGSSGLEAEAVRSDRRPGP